MLRSLDLFPFEAKAGSGLPIQGRIAMRNSAFRLFENDIRSLITQGIIKATDDPDQAQSTGSRGL